MRLKLLEIDFLQPKVDTAKVNDDVLEYLEVSNVQRSRCGMRLGGRKFLATLEV